MLEKIINCAKKGFSSITKTIGIKSSEEKVFQAKINKEIQDAADALKKNVLITDKYEVIKMTDKEVNDINEGHAKILKKAGIPDINEDPNYDRHYQERYDDVWNRYR